MTCKHNYVWDGDEPLLVCSDCGNMVDSRNGNELGNQYDQPTSKAELLPAEKIAMTIASEQLKRGENPPINITTVLVMALERIKR